MTAASPKWPRPATAAAVVKTIANMGGTAWAKRSQLPPDVRRQFERAYGFSNAFFAACINGTWLVTSSRIAALDSATPESFIEQREEIVPGLARDYILRFADPVPVSPDHPASQKLRSMLSGTPYRGKGGAKIYIIRGYDAPESRIEPDGNEEENAFIAYLAVRAPKLSPNAKRIFKDIAESI